MGGRLLLGSCLVVLGLCVALLAAREGSLPWQAVRGLSVLGSTGLMLWIGTRAARGGRGLVAFATGLVGLAVGVGIGLPHLAKQGDLVTTFLALVSLVAGVALWITGGVLTVRAARSWWRLAVVVVLIVVSYLVVYPLAIALAATNVPATAVGPETPGDRGLPYRDVWFDTVDGARLSGWYVPSRNGAAVVALHGSGSTRAGVLDEAEVLARNGYGVLLYDARGHGRSGGRAMDFGWHGDRDVSAAVGFLAGQPDVERDRIGAVGLSMGGEQAIGAAAADHRIRVVVAEGATNRVSADEAWLSDRYGARGQVQEGIEWLLHHATDLLTDAHPPRSLRSAVGASRVPVLLVVAGRVPDEAHAAAFIAGGAPGSVEIWVADDAGHTGGLRARPSAWERRVTGFLDEVLDPAP